MWVTKEDLNRLSKFLYNINTKVYFINWHTIWEWIVAWIYCWNKYGNLTEPENKLTNMYEILNFTWSRSNFKEQDISTDINVIKDIIMKSLDKEINKTKHKQKLIKDFISSSN